MPVSLIGTFDDASAAQAAIRDLQQAGFTNVRLADATTDFDTYGVNADHRDIYRNAMGRGGNVILLQVRDESSVDRAREFLDREGAIDVDLLGEGLRTAGANDTLQVIRENLAVGKREVERGGVRVRSYISEKPVSEQISLREEHVNVERHAVNQPIDPSAIDRIAERTIEVRETAEVPVVAKEARVVEEIEIGKRADQRTETVQDTVRETHVDVEEVGTTQRGFAYADNPDLDKNDSR